MTRLSVIFIIFAGQFKNRMKKIILYSLTIAAILMVAACGKDVAGGPNDGNKRYMDAWMHLYNQRNNTNIQPSGRGIYVLDEKEGDGDITVTDNGYVFVEYTVTDLEGNISSYTSADIAKKLGTYSETTYYGPTIWLTMDATIPAGLQDAVVGMKVGGYKKALIPSWLMSYSTYESGSDYLNVSSDYSNAIYEFTVKDYTDSINVWQIDSIERYITKNYGSLDAFSNDTTGFYYKQVKAPESDKAFGSDTTIYINYVGKLLNGLIFDTNIERVAKDNNLYSADKTYGPVSISWADEHSNLTMGSGASSVISGFSMTLWEMKAMESGIGIFYSPLGYGYSGSEPSIPPYAPLIFEIEIVAAPED